MAERYCDLDLTGGGNDGLAWGSAWETMADMLAGLANGDTCYLIGTETLTGNQVYKFPTGDISNPVRIVGVTTRTSPPVTADVASNKAGDTLPAIGSSDNGDVDFGGDAHIVGVDVVSGTGAIQVQHSGHGNIVFEDCRLETAALELGNNEESGMVTNGTTIEAPSGANDIGLFRGSENQEYAIGFEKLTLGGGSPTYVQLGNNQTPVGTMIGADLSNISNRFYQGAQRGGNARVIGCRLPAGFTFTGGWQSTFAPVFGSRIEAINCGVAAPGALGTNDSVMTYRAEQRFGVVMTSNVTFRNDGADDGLGNQWSYVLEPDPNVGRPSTYWGSYTPWMQEWIAGDGTTSFTVAVHVVNDGGSDLTEEDVWIEGLMPASDGSGRMEFFTSRLAMPEDGTPATLTDVPDADWTLDAGEGAANAQKLEHSGLVPAYQGLVMVRLWYAHNSATPTLLYVDPKLEIT